MRLVFHQVGLCFVAVTRSSTCLCAAGDISGSRSSVVGRLYATREAIMMIYLADLFAASLRIDATTDGAVFVAGG